MGISRSMAEGIKETEEEENLGSSQEDKDVRHICMQEGTIDQCIQHRMMHGNWY